MTDSIQNLLQITEFADFEAREAAFNAAVGNLIPARYSGPQRFWSEFRRITERYRGSEDPLPAYITANPRDCLAFGTVLQVLAAAQRSASHATAPSVHLEDLLITFGLSQARNQPLRTLSGGETVRLSLAKTLLSATTAQRLVVSSPFCWLSRRHLTLLDTVLTSFGDAQKPVDILIMAGESRQDWINGGHLRQVDAKPQSFRLKLDHLRIHLGTPINTITARPVYARVVDFEEQLTSPCLLEGDNGQGKSLVAKALCGAVGFTGSIRIESDHDKGRGRLLFQDVVTQTLLRSIPDLGRIVGRQAGNEPVTDFFHALLDRQHRILQGTNRRHPKTSTAATQHSLLAVKTMLVAVRLALQPGVLILDEPDWGLSREDAIGLVLAVIEKAHQTGVPVILISHKAWWYSVAGSVVTASKTGLPDSETPFEIELRIAKKPAGEIV